MVNEKNKKDANQKESNASWIMSHRFAVFLGALGLIIFILPIANALRTPMIFFRLLVLICFCLMLLSALFAVSRSRKQLILAFILAIPMVILLSLNIIPGLSNNKLIMGLGCIFAVLFLGYSVSLIIVALFCQRSITGDIICTSICGYLLLGLCWAFIYSLIEIIQPGSYSISDASTSLNVIGDNAGFADDYPIGYWSSSEYIATGAWLQVFDDVGVQAYGGKANTSRVRAF